MFQKIDRKLQHAILRKLFDEYPASSILEYKDFEVDRRTFDANFFYLAEHKLITVSSVHDLDSAKTQWGSARLTKDGVDLLHADGGLSAILGGVTIKLHDDTLKALIGQKIEASDLTPPDKRRWSDALRALPADATTHLTMKLLDLGLAHGPDALHAIQTALNVGPI